MNFKGTVTTGLGKGAFFLSKDFYANELEKRCGFYPFPGTLNIIIPDSFLEDIVAIKESCEDVITPEDGFGAVKYIKAILNNEIQGAIIFPAKTVHEENYLEFIAHDKLRDKLNLKDGDEVTLEI